MENAAGLLEDARALLEQGSAGRALSLVVLASEELGKAVGVYRAAHPAWDGEVEFVQVPPDFEHLTRRHPPKLMTAQRYASWLTREFTGQWPAQHDEADGNEFADTANDLNDKKQAGFYVDWTAGKLRQPSEVAGFTEVQNQLRTVAQAAHFLYFEDWSRAVRKFEHFRQNDKLGLRLGLFAYPELKEG